MVESGGLENRRGPFTPLPCNPKGLARVRTFPTSATTVVCFALSDTDENETQYLINPEGLNALLLPALGLASQWADEADLEVKTWSGPQNALPAQHIELAKGRTDKECALRVFVGKVELTFLIPLDAVIHAAAGLVQQIDPASGKPPH